MYGESVYKKTDGVEEEDMRNFAGDPGIKRLKYYSYLVVSESISKGIRAYDSQRVRNLNHTGGPAFTFYHRNKTGSPYSSLFGRYLRNTAA